MAKNYGVSAKELINASPASWAKLSHLVSNDAKVTLIDADASAVSAASDKVAEVREKKKIRYLIMEFQAQRDDELITTSAFREVNLRRQKGDITADTVIFFAHAGALPKGGTLGQHKFKRVKGPPTIFEFTAIKLWEFDPEEMFALGPQMAPLATLCKSKSKEFPKVVERIETELLTVESKEDQNRLWTIAFFLSGIKYKNADFLDKLFKGKFHMESSVTYQQTAQLHETIGEERGKEIGRIGQAREALLHHHKRKLGSVSEDDTQTINSVNDIDLLVQATDMFLDGISWEKVMEFLR